MDNVLDDVIKMCIERLQKDDCHDLDPIAKYISQRVWPYMIAAIVLFVVIMSLLILICIFILHYHYLTKPLLCNRS